ncbi:MAG: hypothetical protein ABSA65_19640, partial [Acidimicrobiales bacterium]
AVGKQLIDDQGGCPECHGILAQPSKLDVDAVGRVVEGLVPKYLPRIHPTRSRDEAVLMNKPAEDLVSS